MSVSPEDGDLLTRMARGSRARAAASRAAEDFDALVARAGAWETPAALRRSGGFDVIAEVKLRSPSAGDLAVNADPAAQACLYAEAGAAAVSVLTEPEVFSGSLAHLAAVAAALVPYGVPVMRKDFLVDPWQVWEARAAGAGGVLVILAMLDDATVDAMLAAAGECRLFVLLEAFDGDELARAGAVAARHPGIDLLVGLNCRDLRTLAIDADRFRTLRAAFPPGVPSVAESGLASADDAARVAALGYDLALVGSALMRAPSPAALLGGMLAAGRQAAA